MAAFPQFTNLKNLNIAEIAADVVEKRTSVLEIIEKLGPVLTSDDKEERKNGVSFLTWMLSVKLTTNSLNEQEVSHFSAFYADRLKDHHSIVPPTLGGILALVQMKNITEKCVGQLLHNIFQFVTCQQQMASDRKIFYSIIRECSQSHLTAIQSMGPDFLFSVISSIEGETDPQNLLLIFSFFPALASKLSINHLSADVYEVFSIYFPVDFTTVVKDGIKITREELAEGLCNCLTATPLIAAECIPMILEKLDSTLKAAKIDCYKLLQRCCEKLEASVLEPHIVPLWKMMQKDLLPPLDSTIQSHALDALSSLTGCLNATSEDMVQKFLDDVIIGVRSLASKPDDSLFFPAMKIYEALCLQSAVGSKRVLLELQVLCRPMKRSSLEVKAIFEAVQPFLKFMKSGDSCLIPIASLYLESTSDVSVELRIFAFSGLRVLYPHLNSEPGWREKLYSAVIADLRNKGTPECYKLVRVMGEDKAIEVLEKVYGPLETDLKIAEIPVDKFLNASAALIVIPALQEHVVEHYIQLGTSTANSAAAYHSLLSACHEDKAVCGVLTDVVFRFVDWWVAHPVAESLQPLSHLLKEVIANASVEQQTLVFTRPFVADIWSKNTIEDHEVILLEGVIGALRPQLWDPREKLGIKIPVLIEKSISSPREEVRESGGRLLASIANKAHEEFTKSLVEKVAAVDETHTEAKVELYSWILKGALLRSLPDLNDCLLHWFSLLDNEVTSRYVAQRTKILLQEEENFLNNSCHCLVGFLYRQRLFTYLPQLYQKLPSISNSQIRDNYLLTCVLLASQVPLQVVKTEESAVAGIVAQTLSCADPEVVSASLGLLKNLMEDRSDLFSDYVTSLLPALLRLALPPTLLSVRRTSLQCLYLAACYPTHLILPYKTEVVRGLLPVLDDRKRVVRAEAVRARSRWCLVGAVGEEAVFPDS